MPKGRRKNLPPSLFKPPLQSTLVPMIPHSKDTARSTRIHVTGDVLNGFQHEIERGYVVAEDDRNPKILFIGEVEESCVPVDESKTGFETVPANQIEEAVLGVPAPGPGLRDASADTAAEEHGRRTRINRKDCQSWIKKVVHVLVRDKLLEARALKIVEAAPEH